MGAINQRAKGALILIRFIVAVALALVLTACVFAPQAVRIRPNVDTPASYVGGGRDLPLTVVDERPRQTLGTRGVIGFGAELSVDGDLSTIVRTALADGLSRQKFKPMPPGGSAASELRVEIRNLDYTMAGAVAVFTLRIDVGLKAICTRGVSRPYEKLHRGEYVETVHGVQSPDANNTYMSSALSTAVNSLLRDDQLLACLAQSS